jgi:hypothetical protein
MAATGGMLHILQQFPLFASAINTKDRLSQTPLHLALYHGHVEFAVELLKLGADPCILDGFGKNCLDWVLGHNFLMQKIRRFYPRVSLTSKEIQNATVRRSISHMADTLLHSMPSPSWVLQQHLGRYLIFLGHLDHARYILQLPPCQENLDCVTVGDIIRDVCHWHISEISGSRFVCRVCARLDTCFICMRPTFYYGLLHLTQDHDMLELPVAPHCQTQMTTSTLRQLNFFLSNLKSQFGSPGA